MNKKVVIGSRESKLAVLQSQMVRDYIVCKHPETDVEILTMKTTGDKILDRTLDKIGGKGLFVKELDRALLEGRSQLSVHSLKDMPMEISEELPILAFSRREDARDVLVLPEGCYTLDPSKPIGCSSLRRKLQLKEIYPDMNVKSIRGNLQTRLEKLDLKKESAGILIQKKWFRQQVRESWLSREEKGWIMNIWKDMTISRRTRRQQRSVPL